MNNEFMKEWLQWVIDFVQMDISKLSLKEKHNFYREFIWFGSQNLLNTSFDPFGKRKQFSQNQILELETIASEIQPILKQFIDTMATHGSYELPELTSWIRPEGIMTRDPRVYFQAHSVPKDLTPKNWAVLNLSRLIQGLEMHVIGRCECGSYFLNFSLRKKSYCSPKCASKYLARSRKKRWSPKKYSAYLKVQRRLVNEAYQEKRAAMGKAIRHRPKKRGSKRMPKMM